MFWIELPDGPPWVDLDAYEDLAPEDQGVYKAVLGFVASEAENFLSHEIGRPLGMSGREVEEALDRLRAAGLVKVRTMMVN